MVLENFSQFDESPPPVPPVYRLSIPSPIDDTVAVPSHSNSLIGPDRSPQKSSHSLTTSPSGPQYRRLSRLTSAILRENVAKLSIYHGGMLHTLMEEAEDAVLVRVSNRGNPVAKTKTGQTVAVGVSSPEIGQTYSVLGHQNPRFVRIVDIDAKYEEQHRLYRQKKRRQQVERRLGKAERRRRQEAQRRRKKAERRLQRLKSYQPPQNKKRGEHKQKDDWKGSNKNHLINKHM